MSAARRVALALVLLALPAAARADVEDTLLARLEHHHAYSARHCRRVGIYAAYLARQLQLRAPEVEAARSAGRLHDLGKLHVPVAILDKPARLTPAEWAVVREHPAQGAALAVRCGVPPEVVAGIRGHHERYDGKGYPGGARAEGAPLIARIVSVADVWDAVTTKRSYQPARTFDEGVKVLRDAAGTQLDPALVRAFLADLPGLRALLARLLE